MRPTRFWFFGAICAFLYASLTVAAENPLKGCEEHVRYGAPKYLHLDHEVEPLCRLGYALSHNADRKVPDWVAWHITKQKATSCADRKNAYKADPELPKGKRAERADYLKSGYDMGHLAPNADFNWSQEAARESFYLSNMAPQIHAFNAGIWKSLEEAERVWATDRGELYIIAGPIFDNQQKKTIGTDKVGVPSHFYKIIYDPNAGEALAFVFPHAQIRNQAIPFFQVTIRKIEELLGLNFMSKLADTTEEQVETAMPKVWDYDRSAWNAAMKKKCG